MTSNLIFSNLCEKFARSAYYLSFYTLLWLRYLKVLLMPIKGLKEHKYETQIVNFADDTIIFLRDIPCLDRIQGILRLYEDASSSKIKF